MKLQERIERILENSDFCDQEQINREYILEYLKKDYPEKEVNEELERWFITYKRAD